MHGSCMHATNAQMCCASVHVPLASVWAIFTVVLIFVVSIKCYGIVEKMYYISVNIEQHRLNKNIATLLL